MQHVGRGYTEARSAGAFVPGFGLQPLRPETLARHGSSFDSLPSSVHLSPPASPLERGGSDMLFTPPPSVLKSLADFHVTSPPAGGERHVVDLCSPPGHVSPSMAPTQPVSPMLAGCSQETLEYKRTEEKLEDLPLAELNGPLLRKEEMACSEPPQPETTPKTATLEPPKAAEPVPTPTPVAAEPKQLTQHTPTRTDVSDETTQVGNNLGSGDTQNAAPADASTPVHGGDKALPLHPPKVDTPVAPVGDASQHVHGGDKALPLDPPKVDKPVAPVAEASQPAHGGDKALPLHPPNVDKPVAPVADASKLAHSENKTPPPAPPSGSQSHLPPVTANSKTEMYETGTYWKKLSTIMCRALFVLHLYAQTHVTCNHEYHYETNMSCHLGLRDM